MITKLLQDLKNMGRPVRETISWNEAKKRSSESERRLPPPRMQTDIAYAQQVTVVEAVNGKIIEFAIRNNHGDVELRAYVVGPEENLSDAIAAMLVIAGKGKL
jgi:hypothetical protein